MSAVERKSPENLKNAIDFARGNNSKRVNDSDLANELNDLLEKRVADYLSQRGGSAFQLVLVEACDGAVTLSGCLRSYHEKQVAISAQHSGLGVRTIIDRLSVCEWTGKESEFPFDV